MFKKFIAILGISMTLFTSSVFAAINTFYFETDWGEEVRVDVYGSYNDPKYVFHNTNNEDSYELFKQYVKSTLDKRNYVYTYQEVCGNECHGADGHTSSDIQGRSHKLGRTSSDIQITTGSRSRQLVKTPDRKASSTSNKLVEGAAQQLGSRAADSIINALTNNVAAKQSPFTILRANDGKPILMCRISGIVCDRVDDVAFNSIDGGWQATTIAPVIGNGDFEHAQSILGAINEFSSYTSTTCKTVYTGAPGRLVAQITCYITF
jgi:hypothetical protein